MITKFKNYLITESPDSMNYNGKHLDFEDVDAKPFFVEVNSDHTKVKNIYVGSFGSCHSDIPFSDDQDKKAYPGRLYFDNKIMAFWVYPNEILFKDIIKNLEEELDIELFNNGWKIEIIKTEDDIIYRKSVRSGDPDDFFSQTYWGDTEIIPIEDYSGSEDVPEEQQIMHLMNWKEKNLAIKAGKFHFKSFGSYKTGWDQPHNIKYRQAIYQENKNNNDN